MSNNENATPSTKSQQDGPRIYVACLASYNSGVLHGAWIDASQEPEEIHAEIAKILRSSREPGAEEFAIHDHDGFLGINIGEYESIDSIVRHAAFVAQHGELGAKVVEYIGSLDDAEASLDENYQGAFDTLADWASNTLEETGELEGLPERLRSYFDYEAFGKDAEMSGDIFTIDLDGKCHVFWSR